MKCPTCGDDLTPRHHPRVTRLVGTILLGDDVHPVARLGHHVDLLPPMAIVTLDVGVEVSSPDPAVWEELALAARDAADLLREDVVVDVTDRLAPWTPDGGAA